MTSPPEDEPTRIHVFEVEAAEDGQRLDRVLKDRVPELSRALIQKHIEAGAVLVDGAPMLRTSQMLRRGATVEYAVPEPETTELVAEDIPISILHEDEDIVVVDKSADLVVHPGAGHPRGTLVNALLFHVRNFRAIAGEVRPGIVHRLDRDTSGVMVVAKTERAFFQLTHAFQARTVAKRYLAVVHGLPHPEAGTIESMIGRSPHDRRRFTSRTSTGKSSVTHYEVGERYPGASLVDVRIETGRTHQIRVHLSERGWPLVGDPMYGAKPSRITNDPRTKPIVTSFPRTALHAAELAFPHPADGRMMRFQAPLPPDLEGLIEALRSVA